MLSFILFLIFIMSIISIKGARTHNLKNIDLEIPRDQLVVVTGLSGSGKSSLAFDTLYAEGQRRYVDSLSVYARQFLQMMEKPDVELIEGLSPAISIEQKVTIHNPRSTVGTITEVYDYLRLLFARIGTPYCPEHLLKLDAMTVSEMVDRALMIEEGVRILILAPVVQEKKGEHIDLINQLRAQGFVRLRINGNIVDIDEAPSLAKSKKHTIEVVVDRFKLLRTEEIQSRLADSVETALRCAEGKVIILENDSGKEHLFSEHFACVHCGFSISELEPRLFSFNSPMGACGQCDGLGETQFFDAEKIVSFPELSLESGAIKGWDKRSPFYHQMILSLSKHYAFNLLTPYEKLDDSIKKMLLWGSGQEKIQFTYTNAQGRQSTRTHCFEGIINNFERRYKETTSNFMREELAKYITSSPCPACKGSRLNLQARHVKITDQTLPELSRLSLRDCAEFFEKLKLSDFSFKIAEKVIQEISARLQFLIDVGLDYLSLDRSAGTLSGGEAQRIRLASQIGSGLTGVLYVLDEPSIGLHQRDNDRLLATLNYLKSLGNSLIVVEHDEDTINQADFVIDMGPGAGKHGGEVVVSGPPSIIKKHSKSLTGDYLSGRKRIAIPCQRQRPSEKKLFIKGASGNNLKTVSVEIPIGLLTCLTGVSGSGKSTLINDTLYAACHKKLHNGKIKPQPYEEIGGLEHIDKIINVSQSAIGRTPRSNPATYTGILTPIRDLFSQVPESRKRGYSAGRFSFNVKGGRCESCSGDGLIKVEMHFLPDVFVPCDVCRGRRYNRETLEIRYKGKNIHDVLEMTVEQAYEFFKAVPVLEKKLSTLIEVGLSYINLGQSATTLSGGEAQRIKLALELSKRDTGRTLYVLDEPTTGLHFHDINLLLKVLHRLRDHGNTVIIIEHNLDVIKTADWIIDLGPEGGLKGGEVLASCPPEQLIHNKRSYTGRFLKPYLK